MTAFANHFAFEFRTGVRNRTLLLMNYLLPLGFYMMMGFVMKEDINPGFVATMIPSMVVFAILAATILGLPDPLVHAREMGVLRSYKINGIPAVSILVIPALTSLVHMVIVAIGITITAPSFFQATSPINWVNFVIVFALTAFACAGFGVLIGVISGSTRITVLWSQMIFLPSVLLGGMMIPYSMLPDMVGKAAQLLPTTHAMNAFRGLAFGMSADFNPIGSMIVLFAGGVTAFLLAIYLFNWDSKNNVDHGKSVISILVLLPFIVGIFFL